MSMLFLESLPNSKICSLIKNLSNLSMKKYLLLLYSLLISSCLFSQNTQGRVTYTQVIDYKNMPNQMTKDSCVLYFQAQKAVFIERPQIKTPQTTSKTVELKEANFKMKANSIEYSTHFYKLSDKKKIYQECYDEKKPYYLDDVMPDFNWTITSETKNIGGYDCAKAISNNFRGRIYEAWFTYLIPSSAGPWKLGGLPGLILEASDQTGEIKFMFTSLQIPNQEKVNYEVPQGVEFKNWEEHKKYVQKKINEAFKVFEAIGGKIDEGSEKMNGIESFDY
jgi:GLPGLI family protein